MQLGDCLVGAGHRYALRLVTISHDQGLFCTSVLCLWVLPETYCKPCASVSILLQSCLFMMLAILDPQHDVSGKLAATYVC